MSNTPDEVTDEDRLSRPNQEVVREPDGDPTNVGEADDDDSGDPVEPTTPVPDPVPDPDPDPVPDDSA